MGSRGGWGSFELLTGAAAQKGKMKRCVSVQGQEASVAFEHVDCPMAVAMPVAGLLEIDDVLLVWH